MKKLILTLTAASLVAFSSGQSVSTVAGINGNSGFMPYSGSPTSVPIAGAYGIAFDTSGYMYVADNVNHRISLIIPGNTVVAKCGHIGDPTLGGATYINATGSNAKFNQPSGMVFNSNNELFICDYNNNAIRRVAPFTNTTSLGSVSTFAGEAPGVNSGGGHVDGSGADVRFNGPIDIAVDGNGNLYVADNWNEVIRKITPGGVVSTLCGSAGQNGDVDGTGTAARFNNILAVEMLDNTYLLVADGYNNKIRKVNVNTGEVTTFAGNGNTGHVDGSSANAEFNGPSGLAVDAFGNVYVSEGAGSQSNVIRRISTNGTVSTLAGAYQSGTDYADGPGTDARFKKPAHIAFNYDKSVLFVCDFNNNVLRAIDMKPIARFVGSPTNTNTGVPVQLTDNSFGNPSTWNWVITPNTGFTLENGTTLSSQNPQLKFTVANTYTVKLTVTNAFGSGDTTRNNYLNISNINTTDPPVADFVASDSTIMVNDIVTFTDKSQNSPNQWTWAIVPSTHQFVNSTTKNSQNPQVQFTGVGSYTVILNATNNNGNDVKSKNNYIQVDPLGVRQVDFNQLLSVFPNPNNGSFQIRFDESFQHSGLEVIVYDMNGKEVRHLDMMENNTEITGLNAGVYLVRVSDGSNTYNQKVVVK